MGKNKKKTTTEIPDYVNTCEDPEQLKAKSNKCYALSKEHENLDFLNIALIHMNKAISLTEENPNHIYFANRALLLMDLGHLQPALDDCNMVIKMKPDFIKVYWRKGKVNQIHGKFAEAMAAIQEGYKIDPENAELKALEAFTQREIDYANMLPKDDVRKGNIDALALWLAMSDAKTRSCSFRYLKKPTEKSYVGDSDRGVQAHHDISKGDIVIDVPEKCLININHAAQTPLAQQMTTVKIREAIQGDMVTVIQMSVLAAYILNCKKNKDLAPQWAQYLAILPKSADMFPEMMPEEDLKWLEGSMSLAKYNRSKDMFKGHHAIYTEMCPDFTFTFEEYVWAFKTVMSRQMLITTGNQNMINLVPGIDMLNHAMEPNCQIKWERTNRYMQAHALRDIKQDEELTFLYAIKSNFDYLQNWGFTLPSNPNTMVQLPTWLDEKDPLYEEKKKLVDDEVTSDFMMDPSISIKWNTALSRMRFYATKDLEWIEYWKQKFFNEWEQDQLRAATANVAAIQDGYGTWGGGNVKEKPKPKYTALNIFTPVDVELEVEAWKLFSGFAEKALAKYPQTLDEDLALIQKDAEDKHLSYNQRNLLQLRHEEKKVLQVIVDGYAIVQKWAAMDADDAKIRMAEAVKGSTEICSQMSPTEFQMRGYLATCIVSNMKEKEAVAQR